LPSAGWRPSGGAAINDDDVVQPPVTQAQERLAQPASLARDRDVHLQSGRTGRRIHMLRTAICLSLLATVASAGDAPAEKPLTGAATPANLALAPADRDAADHAALLSLFPLVTAALNTQKLDDLAPLLAPGASLTFVDQSVAHDVPELKATFARWLNASSDLAGVTFVPLIDRPAQIIGDTALVTGTSRDLYHLKDGNTLTVPARWSATLLRQDGAWRLASLHCGANLVDNPILDIALMRAKQSAVHLIWLVTASALLAGLVVGLFAGRRSARSTLAP